jgi:Pyruvate/2-oxoacid:ferredoxin oxidoreductase delta subunit
MAIENLQVYFFSGTGNARHVAGWIGDEAVSRGIPVVTTDIAKTDRKKIARPEPGTLLGFISPTHGFNYPPVMLYFIFRFPRARNNRVFIMNTRAGVKLSKYFIPGLSGIALWLSAIVLLLKGYKITGMRSIDLPSNWISAHPGLKKIVVESIYQRCERITRKFASKVFDGKVVLTAFRDIIQDILVAPISIGYFFVGRFIFAKSFYANELCDNCDLCINNCPVKAIIKVDGRPFWSYRCESCMRCMNTCPKRAIETAHGFIVGVMLVLNMVVMFYFWKEVDALIPLPKDNGFISILMTFTRWGVTFITMVVTYRIFHYLLRVPVLREIFYYTSLTRFRFWRRYKPGRKM